MAAPRVRRGGFAHVDKPQNFKRTLFRLIGDFKPLLPNLLIVSLIVLISVAFALLSPLLIRDIINDVIANYQTFFILENDLLTLQWPLLLSRFGIVAAFYVGTSFFNWLSTWLVVPVSARYAYNMRQRFQAKIDKLPLSYFDKQTYGEILSKGTNDVDAVAGSLQSILTSILFSLFLFVGATIAMFISSWQLALVAIASLPLSILITIFIAKNSQKRFKQSYEKLGNLNSHIEENYGGFKIVKLFNKEQENINKFDEINTELAKADRYAQFFSSVIFPSIHFVNNLAFVGICVVGGLIQDVGNMVAFFVLISLFQQPFQQIGQISNIIQSTIAAAERIFSVFDEKELISDESNALKDSSFVTGNVCFDNVTFSYSPEVPLIENLNLNVDRGSSIAIVGPTGAGKTTLVNLIMRFYEVNSGKITIDNKNITDYTYEALRSSIGMVLQDTWLFTGTIKENIRYGNGQATDEEVEIAAKAAHAHFFITTLPGGYDFMLNEEGTNLSIGQRQLITIARAILCQPRILILDEATSSVDTRTEVAIQSAMTKLMKDRTSFVIAHRLSTIKNAKTILVMNRGEIIEIGNHKQLLDKKGFYADLYNAQFLGGNPLAPAENNT
jgi:ATP-binding cassette, subfamily B, multidrug efflux pump